ncbi:WbqC family protein [Gracilimonas sp.]|uniref:WbqC family protein n=1 Tax=Gracilimonas sp. TaxID=1974203 RepID=UPI0028710A65|nr:WbqC family protein [Gracilimonas sp.]
MRVALHQPQFSPNLFDLATMLKADLIVWDDMAEWSRKGRTHRAQIRGEHGLQWINLPIVTEDRSKPIKDVRIDHFIDWFEPLWNAIYHNYQNATYFDLFVDELHNDFETAARHKKLVDFNVHFFSRMLKYLEINLTIHYSSEIKEYDIYPDTFAENLGADILYQEHRSRHYQRHSEIASEPLDNHPTYPQVGDGFLKGCCLIDLLLNCGKESFKILDQLKLY